MTKEVDALVLIGKAYDISSGNSSNVEAGDIAQGLHYVRKKTKWADGDPITEENAHNLWAGELFVNLGGLVANRLLANDDIIGVSTDNPALPDTLSRIDELSPFEEGESLQDYLQVRAPGRQSSLRRLVSLVFQPVLRAELQGEYSRKWSIAQSIDMIDSAGLGLFTVDQNNGVTILRAALEDLRSTREAIR